MTQPQPNTQNRQAYVSPRHFVSGQWIEAGEDRSDILDPSTGEAVGTLPHAGRELLDRALAAAERGFAVWRRVPALERHDILMRAAALLRQRAEAAGVQMTIENGKPLAESIEEVVRAASFIEWDAGEGRRAYGNILPGAWQEWRMVLREPVGPVAAFTPWNFPISSPARKLGAALAAGCSVVLKPSEETPAASVVLVQALLDAGMPEDVVSLVYGDPAMISEHLIRSPVIRAVSFTGSVPVGKLLAGLAGSLMKPVLMELGGHAPVVVCAGADPDRVAVAAAAAKFRNAGQVCTSPTRFIVHESVHDAFVAAFARAASRIQVGDGFQDGVQMGPVVSRRRFDAVSALIADATRKGAEIACGGNRIGDAGNFLAPTILTDVRMEAEILNTEPFGPVAPVLRYGDVQEALAEANRLPYGLFAYVFTDSQSEAFELIAGIESGMVSVNNFGTSQPDTPFGGVKDSGQGREGGHSSLDGYMKTKFVGYRTGM